MLTVTGALEQMETINIRTIRHIMCDMSKENKPAWLGHLTTTQNLSRNELTNIEK